MGVLIKKTNLTNMTESPVVTKTHTYSSVIIMITKSIWFLKSFLK
jgi:hypothetical protein